MPVTGRRAKTLSTDAQKLPENLAGFLHHPQLFLRADGVKRLMTVTVIRHFMAASDNRLTLFRPVLHDPRGDEKCRRKLVIIKQIKNALQRAVGSVSAEGKVIRFLPEGAVKHRITGRAVEVKRQRHAAAFVLQP